MLPYRVDHLILSFVFRIGTFAVDMLIEITLIVHFLFRILLPVQLQHTNTKTTRRSINIRKPKAADS